MCVALIHFWLNMTQCFESDCDCNEETCFLAHSTVMELIAALIACAHYRIPLRVRLLTGTHHCEGRLRQL